MYPFHGEYRAQCVQVVDGDTVDLFVDCGHHNYAMNRYRLARVNTAEMNSKSEQERELAEKARVQVVEWICPTHHNVIRMANLDEWPLRIVTKKNPDGFGRWLAEVFFTLDGKEVNVGDKLIELKLARKYER